MMDIRTRVSNSQAVTTSDVSDNSLNLGAANKELGINKIILHVICDTAFTGLNSGLIIHIIDGTGIDGNGEINAGERELCSTGTLAQSEFTSIGGHWQLALPARRLQQYLGVRYEPVSEAGVSGTFIAWFDEQPESDVTY